MSIAVGTEIGGATTDSEQVLDLIVPGMHCAGCIRSIEDGLASVGGVISVRANLGERRVRVVWTGQDESPITERLSALGFDWHLGDDDTNEQEQATARELLIALAVAGFASTNVMLLSVSVWSGAEAETRSLFHWISALIATPAVLYAGRLFYRSAAKALTARRLNMDVPISLAVLLALGMSLSETMLDGEVAYFDASISLLFFLLIGRVLDHRMRQRARRSIAALARLVPPKAMVLDQSGREIETPLQEIAAGTRLRIRPGDRVPIDGRVISGASDVDFSLVTGESIPVAAEIDTELQAGTLNLNGVLEMETTALSRDSFISRMRAMMTAVENARPPHHRLVDKVAALYAPAVHILAFVTFTGWMVASGDWRQATYAAITVLIITCPCALGLAAPVVQVVAAGRLFRNGILARGGEALERLAGIRRVVFDKTGTLTVGEPRLIDADQHSDELLATAAGLALNSRHPLCQALVKVARQRGVTPRECGELREQAGSGLEGRLGGGFARLGGAAWCGVTESRESDHSTVHLVMPDGRATCFHFADRDRPALKPTLDRLRNMGLEVEILSGDRAEVVAPLARRLGVERFGAGLTPAAKLERIQALRGAGTPTLMVGDGLNDVPVLAAADVSMTPMSAADIGRARADFVFLRDSLEAVPEVIEVARLARRRIRENITLAIVYNCIAVPIAMAGLATPLIATIAMSTSSILVTANALRLQRTRRQAAPEPTSDPANKPANKPVGTTPTRQSEVAS